MQKKPLAKFNIFFYEKALMKLGIQGMYLNIIRVIYDKPITNFILRKN
jgi:hypothetical protein